MKIKSFLRHLNLRSTHFLPKLNKTAKIIVTICLIFCLSLSLKSIFAVEKTVDMTDVVNTYSQKEQAISKGNNQESWIYESLASNGTAIIQSIAGPQEENIKSVVASLNNSTPISWQPGGLLGFTTQSIAYLYQPAASGVQYIAQSVDSFLGKTAYAADNGFGFNKLSGILTMWKTVRNAVYTIISLFFIVVGIMIMLRVKISPQATVTIQSAIPGIISSLILVTFSYAIAGLLIDTSNLVLGIVLSLINSGFPLASTQNGIGKTIQQTMSMGIFDFSGLIASGLFSGVAKAVVTIIGGIIGGVVLVFLASAGSAVMGTLAFIFLLLIIYIFIVIQMVKLFFGLAKCYVNIIIQIILGPIQIGMGAIPGSKVNFSTWFNNLIAQIAVFPASIIFLVFSIFLVKTLDQTSTSLWSPTLLGAGQVISFLVGFACLSILAKIPDVVPEIIFGIKPSPLGKMIGEGNPVAGMFGAVTKGVSEKFGGEFAIGSKNATSGFSNFISRHRGKAEDLKASADTAGTAQPATDLNIPEQPVPVTRIAKDPTVTRK